VLSWILPARGEGGQASCIGISSNGHESSGEGSSKMRGNKGSTDAFWVNNTALNKVYGASDIGFLLDDAGAEQVRGVCAWTVGSRFNLANACS
jgi:hypothetical protein